MKNGLAARLVKSFVRGLRVCAIMVGFGFVILSPDYCPTGQTDCAMAGMDLETKDPVCVLACGVPFPYSFQAAPALTGKVSGLPVPLVLIFAGIVTKPDVPPPRFPG